MRGTLQVDTSELYHFGNMLGVCRESLQLNDTRPDAGQVGDGGLHSALDHFFTDWNYKRTDLADRLGKLSVAVTGAAATYVQVEMDLQHTFSTTGPEGPRGGHWGMVGDVSSGRVKRFDSKGPGRADIVEAFYGTTDGSRVQGDEIEIRKLDNGRYIIVLPGVVDLSDKLGAVGVSVLSGHGLAPWRDGAQPDTVRRMEYAEQEARDSGDVYANPYATRVMEQMKAAGIPSGADVMFEGHSFGAYTAMELAGSDFNGGSGTGGQYHVNVTHVLAAGADTNWKMPELPTRTHALIVNNNYDAAFNVEDGLQTNVQSHVPGQMEVVFNGGNKGVGHHPDNYANWMTNAKDRTTVNDWFDNAGSLYSGSGTSYAVKVPDYH
ncbi:MAG: hypothetical protein JWR83_981 [Aeromicrobium sp.]|nr:hypothetical protein [Aeromicrobium sp.]